MYSAPAVSYPVRRSVVPLYTLVLLWLLGAAVWLAWVIDTNVMSWRHGLALAILLVSGILALIGWRRAPTGQLRWDTTTWLWAEDRVGMQGGSGGEGIGGSVTTHLDFQRVLLLKHWGEERKPRWLWLERNAEPTHWQDLRRAVHAQPRTAVVTGDPFIASGTSKP